MRTGTAGVSVGATALRKGSGIMSLCLSRSSIGAPFQRVPSSIRVHAAATRLFGSRPRGRGRRARCAAGRTSRARWETWTTSAGRPGSASGGHGGTFVVTEPVTGATADTYAFHVPTSNQGCAPTTTRYARAPHARCLVKDGPSRSADEGEHVGGLDIGGRSDVTRLGERQLNARWTARSNIDGVRLPARFPEFLRPPIDSGVPGAEAGGSHIVQPGLVNRPSIR
jgi:hypothetical protein